jgi:hypothetical protein
MAETLKRQIARALAEASSQIVPVNQSANSVPARSYPSPAHTYQEDAQFVNPFDRTHVTMRGMWKIDQTAIQQTKVITTALPPAISNAVVLASSPSTTGASLIAVPDMTVAIRTTGAQVQINWSVSASLSSSANFGSFALFRDNVQIGPTVYGDAPGNNQNFTVSESFVDSPSLGLHAYSVYWATSGGTLTADKKNRYISALILRPQ